MLFHPPEVNRDAETQVWDRIWLIMLRLLTYFSTLSIGTSSNSFERVEKCHEQVHKDSQVKGNTAPEGHVASTPVQERLSCKREKQFFSTEHLINESSRYKISLPHTQFIFRSPKSTASTAVTFMAYSDVYQITLLLPVS